MPNETNGKKRCYFWRTYKYSVDISNISLKGWVEWCNELFKIQHGKPRPKNNRIFIDPDMTTAIVKARYWNRAAVEKWLNDHGYSWTCNIEIKHQFNFDNPDDVILVDADIAPEKKRGA